LVGLAAAYAAPSVAAPPPHAGFSALAPWLLAAVVVGALLALAGVVIAQQRRARDEVSRLKRSLAVSASWTWSTDASGVVTMTERGHRAVDWFDCASLVGHRPWEITGNVDAPPTLVSTMVEQAPFFDVRLEVGLQSPGAAR
jgi:hypothetical protein